MENNNKILVIGSVGYDEKIQLDEMPEIGRTKLGKIEISLGGKGNIEAVACAKTEGETIFLGAVGDRDYENLRRHFEGYNVTAILKKVKNIPSHTACILIDKEGKHRIIADPRASFYVNKKLILDNINLINNSSFILLQLEINFETIEYVITEYKDKKPIILRPSPLSELDRVRKLIKDLRLPIIFNK